jgi:Flp pilus assembly protein TadB
MSLTNDERRLLDELAGQLAHDDPELARALTEQSRPRSGRANRPRPFRRARRRRSDRPLRAGLRLHVSLQRLALIFTMLSLPFILVGLVGQRLELFTIGAVMIVIGPVYLATIHFRRPRP